MTTPPSRTARRRAVLAACLLAVVAGGVLLVVAAFRPPAAPEPSETFDLRAHAAAGTTGPSRPATSGASTRSTAGPAGPPVVDPRRVRIPDLGVDAPVRRETVTADGELVVPGDPRVIGSWHGEPARAAAVGTLVLAGHVDSRGDLGAFHPLSRIGPGAVVDLVDAAGRTESWRVEALEVRRKDALPAFPEDGPRRLALVTCGGPVVHTAHGRGYRDNVIVWATPAPS